MPKNRFFFLHIPKTAGSSLHRMLHRSAGPYLHLVRRHELYWTSSPVWQRFKGCGGHLRWAEAQAMGYTSGFTFTFLRDPLDRVLSQYGFSQLEGHGNIPDAMLARGFDLKQLLRRSAGRFGSFWNAQTFALSGLAETELCPEKHLESALSNLEKLDFLGTTEAFERDTLELMQLLGGLGEAYTVPRENQTPNRLAKTQLDEETSALLAETQGLDRALYGRAQELQCKRRERWAEPLSGGAECLIGWPKPTLTSGSLEAQIDRVEVRGTGGGALLPGSQMEILVHWNASRQLSDAILGIRIEDAIGNYIGGTNTFTLTSKRLTLPAGPSFGIFKFPITMGAGQYVVDIALHRDAERICWISSATTFTVTTPLDPYREGMVDIQAQVVIQKEDDLASLPLSEARQIRLSIEPHWTFSSDIIEGRALISNGSGFVLSSSFPCRVFVSYHWASADRAIQVYEGARCSLPRPIWPGETLPITVFISPPPSFGEWRLQLRLLQENVRWHEGQGFDCATPPEIRIEYQRDILRATSLITPAFSHK